MSLIEAAKNCGVPVEEPLILDGRTGRLKSGSELEWLERHLFRPGRRGRQPYPARTVGEQDASGRQILMRSCADPYDEAVSAAVMIKDLLAGGMRYRDIAVVCGSLKDYSEYIKRVFDTYEIPYFIDRSSSVILNPAFEFVESCIDVLEKNYSYESVMRLIRTGLVPGAVSNEADLLENYLLAAGIRGRKAWSSSFTRQTKNGDEALRLAAESARSVFMEKFLPFDEVMKKGKAPLRERAAALWQFILDCDIPGKMMQHRDACVEDGREDRAAEYDQVIRVIAGVCPQTAAAFHAGPVFRIRLFAVKGCVGNLRTAPDCG